MNPYKKLLNNTIIFTVGNFGSKLISFLLVPLYTYYLTTEEYGNVDLTLTIVSMLIPIISLCMHEAILRFMMDKSVNKNNAFTNATIISIVGFALFLLLYPLLHHFEYFKGNLPYIYIILFVQITNQLFAQFARSIDQIKAFALNGIIITFFTGLFNILFIVEFNYGVIGYYLSIILANIIGNIYLILVSKPYEYFDYKLIDIFTMRSLLTYSIPLIPNNLMWWLINSSSRFIITSFIGLSANGLFAVSSKIPTIINIVSSIFTQSWQMSAFDENKEENESAFYSKTFNSYASLLFIVSSGTLIFLKIAFNILFETNYFAAWQATPFLILGSVFSALSSFVGVTYTASKATSGVFKTSIIGGGVSVLLNFILIPQLGIVGAGISSMVSFFLMLMTRIYDTKKFTEIIVNYQKFFLNIIIIQVQIMIMFLNLNLLYEIIILVALFIFLLFFNNEIIKMLMLLMGNLYNRIVKR